MQHLDWIWLITRWLHILAVIVAIGGSIYSYLAFMPASQASLDEPDRTRLRDAVRQRWAKFVHISIAILLITGGINFVMGAIPPRPPKVPAMPYHAIFGVKLILALVIFFLASALLGKSPGFARMREHARRWFGVIAVLGLVIVLLSGMLNQIRHGETRQQASGRQTEIE